VFQRLADKGLAVNLEKCEFVVEELHYLGHRLSAASITSLTGSLQFSQATHCQGFSAIFGHGEFLPSVFTKNCTDPCLLTDLLKGKDLPKVLLWEKQHDAAFAAAIRWRLWQRCCWLTCSRMYRWLWQKLSRKQKFSQHKISQKFANFQIIFAFCENG
jgi:hypothetical protein